MWRRFMVWNDHNDHFCARCVYCSVNHNLVTSLCCLGSSWRKNNSWLVVFNCHIVPRNLLNIKPNIRNNSQLCPYDIKHIIFGNFTHLCNFLCTPSFCKFSIDRFCAQIKFRKKKTQENVLHRFGILPLGDSGRKVVEKWVGDSLAEWPSHLSYFVFLS